MTELILVGLIAFLILFLVSFLVLGMITGVIHGIRAIWRRLVYGPPRTRGYREQTA